MKRVYSDRVNGEFGRADGNQVGKPALLARMEPVRSHALRDPLWRTVYFTQRLNHVYRCLPSLSTRAATWSEFLVASPLLSCAGYLIGPRIVLPSTTGTTCRAVG